MLWIGCVWLIAANMAGFLLFGYDKRCAVRHKWRVPEKTLFLAALLGGSVGSYAGMHLFRHKTRHWKFRAWIPFLMLLQCALVLWILRVDLNI